MLKNKLSKLLKLSTKKIALSIYSEYKPDNKFSIEKNESKNGYFFLRSTKKEPIVYSVGIGSDINFGLELIQKRNATVFGFDPTDQTENFLSDEKIPERFSFFKCAVSGDDGMVKFNHIKNPHDKYLAGTTSSVEEKIGKSVVESKKVTSIASDLGHESIDILKIDAEGAEYDIIDSMIKDSFFPNQIVLEFHPDIINKEKGRKSFSIYGWKVTARFVSNLKKEGYVLCHRSERGREFLFAHERILGQ